MSMLAELYGKISQSGNDLNGKLEDDLTGNFFGSLRYIPFGKALQKIFVQAVYPPNLAKRIANISAGFWNQYIKFWPNNPQGEIDVLIDFPETTIGVEVKYRSGLSSDDAVDNSTKSAEEEYELSIQQLAREARIVASYGKNKGRILLLVANSETCREIFEKTSKRDILRQNVDLGYASWQDILEGMKALELTDPFHKLIVDDLIALLIKKQLERFQSFILDEDFSINDSQYYSLKVTMINRLIFNSYDYATVKGELFYDFR